MGHFDPIPFPFAQGASFLSGVEGNGSKVSHFKLVAKTGKRRPYETSELCGLNNINFRISNGATKLGCHYGKVAITQCIYRAR